MTGPLVSIITVTFNSSQTISDTLDSIRSQTYTNIEHVVIDGASSDATMTIVKRAAEAYPTSIRYISEPDEGIYDAMNKGVAQARGEIVGILNSDDVLFGPRVIESVVTLMEAEGSDGCYGDLVFVDWEDTNVVRRTWIAGVGDMRLGWVAPHPTLYLRRSTYDKVGAYRNDFKISSDYDLMLRVFRPEAAFKISYLPEFLVRMRNGGTSTRNLRSNWIGFVECQTSLRSQAATVPTLTNVLRLLRKFKQLLPSTHGLHSSSSRHSGRAR